MLMALSLPPFTMMDDGDNAINNPGLHNTTLCVASLRSHHVCS